MKAKILQQSIDLFEKKGFSETSIQDIVDALGVTKGTFYYYFTSKEQLLIQIHLEYIDDILARQRQIIEHPDKSWEDGPASGSSRKGNCLIARWLARW